MTEATESLVFDTRPAAKHPGTATYRVRGPDWTMLVVEGAVAVAAFTFVVCVLMRFTR